MHNNRKVPFLRLLLPFVLLFAFAANAEDGVPLVRARLAFVYQAVADTVGTASADRFFRDWNESDVEALEYRLRQVVHQLPTVSDAESARILHGRWARNLTGALGEGYGTATLRAELPPDTLHLGEHEYHLLNGSNEIGRPVPRVDGLFYQVDGGRLIVRRILESKMGGASFKRQQLNGVLAVWNDVGLHTPQGHFPPDRIDLQLGERQVPFTELAASTDIDPVVSLVSSRRRSRNTYNVIQLSLTTGELRDSVTRITASGLSPAEREHCLEGISRAELILLRPRLERLASFLDRQKRWPSSRAPHGGEEQRIAMWVSGYEHPVSGLLGQAAVYSLLSAEHRALFRVRLRVRLRVEAEQMHSEVLAGTLALDPAQQLDVRMAAHPQNVVNEWIAGHQDWPGQRADDPLEARLAIWLNGFKDPKSQTTGMQAFYRVHLSPENWRIPTVLGAVDPDALWMAAIDGLIAVPPADLIDVRFRAHPETLLDEWITAEQRWPSSGANGSLENRLAAWVYGYKDAQGRKSQAAVFLLLSKPNQDLPAIQLSVRRQEVKRAAPPVLSEKQRASALLPPDAVNRFVAVEKRFPSANAPRGSEEKVLAKWVQHQPGRTGGVYRDVLTPENQAIFGVRLSGDPEGLWADYQVGTAQLTDAQVLEMRMALFPVAYLDEWIAENSKWPSQLAVKGTPERKLALWIQGQGSMATVFPRLSQANRRLFVVRLGAEPEILWRDYRAGRAPAPSVAAMLDLRMGLHPVGMINEWIAKNERWPSATSKKADETERRLGLWINKNGAQAKFLATHLSPANRRRYAIRLDHDPAKLLADYRAMKVALTADQVAEVRLAVEPEELVREFVHANGHWPRQTGPLSEQRLYRWIKGYRHLKLTGRDAAFEGLFSPAMRYRLELATPKFCGSVLFDAATEDSAALSP